MLSTSQITGESTGSQDRPILDGFVLSLTQLYLPTSYRVHALAQMEVLRRAKGYRPRWYTVPEDLQNPVPAYSQVEYQVSVEPGSYVWGLTYSQTLQEAEAQSVVHIQLTDACTETAFYSDYVKGGCLEADNTTPTHSPILINPRIIGKPGTINVELYNSGALDVICQLVILVAEPQVPNDDMMYALKQAGVID